MHARAGALRGLRDLGASLGLAALLITIVPAANAQASAAAASAVSAVSASVSASASAPADAIRPVDDAWRAALPREAAAATQAYLDRLPASAKERSNAYFEGGYWLQLWNFLLGLAVAWAMLGRQRAARVRDWAQRIGRRAWARDAIFGACYALAGWVLSLPLTVYQGFVREHAYGLATQGLAAWFGEQLTGLGVSVVVSALAVSLLYAVFRRTGAAWWAWGTGVCVLLLALMVMVGPVWIEPLFNTYKPVEPGPARDAVLAMAHANAVPVDNVYVFDASRQTTRVSANVSGLFGTAAVRLNDNLLRRSSLPEIRAVMAHELGHYVMNHIPKMMVGFGLVILAGFLFARGAMAWALARWGSRWGLQGLTDVASLPLLGAVFAVFFFVATPMTNTIIRVQEVEADRFGLNLAREPHGMAEVLLKLTEYRKPDPGAVEEILFYDHPSTRARILDAMRWREAMGTAP